MAASGTSSAPVTTPFNSVLQSPPTVISVGDVVAGAFQVHGTAKAYDVTASSSGTLVVRVTWTPAQGRVELDLADRVFADYTDNRSPLIGVL
jgi:hypothetical protein